MFLSRCLTICAVLMGLGISGQISSYTSTENDLTAESGQTVSGSFEYNMIYTINITNISTSSRVLMLQAIALDNEVTISLDGNFSDDATTTGNSTGVVAILPSIDLGNPAGFLSFFNVSSDNNSCTCNRSQTVVITTIELNTHQPIPGGCNYVHTADIYPNLDPTSHDKMVEVKFSQANIGYSFGEPEPVCDVDSKHRNSLIYDIYVTFLQKNLKILSCSTDSQCGETDADFVDVIKMGSNINPVTSAKKITTLTQKQKSRFYLSRVRNNAAAFLYVNVRDPVYQTSSLYVPLLIVGDSPTLQYSYQVVLYVLLVVFMMLGLLLCLAGHRLFPFELFMFGALFILLICSIVLEVLQTTLKIEAKLGTASGFAVVGGLLLVSLWWRFDCGVYCSLIVGLVGGFLFASIVFVTPLINVTLFRNQLAYMMTFICFNLAYVLFLTLLSPHRQCIVTSSFVGSYIIVGLLGSGVFFNSVTSEIVMFTVWRFSVTNFANAIIVYPFFTIDKILISVWGVLFLIGCVTQFLLQKSRPNFPSSPYKCNTLQCNEAPHDVVVNVSNDDVRSVSTIASSGCVSLTSENYDGDISEHDDMVGSDDDSAEMDDTDTHHLVQ
ncbi:unnamed protein product [Clavelina lepadiformis]|uniref:TM7S3/TM198-like domain-containing protein n=1 Tax=Clavelina lepadiformis TaxID=159417 RepID=A0ABP0GBI6_CLALP